MTDIKRYACEVYFNRGLYEHSDGLFVSYEDHAAIIAEKDARIAELETMFQKKVVQDGNKITALQAEFRVHESIRRKGFNQALDAALELDAQPKKPVFMPESVRINNGYYFDMDDIFVALDAAGVKYKVVK